MVDNLCEDCKRRCVAGGSSIIKWICPHCFEEKSYPMTSHPKICRECSEKTNRCQRCLKELK